VSLDGLLVGLRPLLFGILTISNSTLARYNGLYLPRAASPNPPIGPAEPVHETWRSAANQMMAVIASWLLAGSISGKSEWTGQVDLVAVVMVDAGQVPTSMEVRLLA
jgi:hypothetical protein